MSEQETNQLATVEQPGQVASSNKRKRATRNKTPKTTEIKPIDTQKQTSDSLQAVDLKEQGREMGKATVSPLIDGYQEGQAEALKEFSELVNNSQLGIQLAVTDFMKTNYSDYVK